MSIPGADVQTKLDEIVALVEAAKSGALSSTTVKIDRAELLAALDELRELLPREISDARALLRRRDEIVSEASTQASGIVATARSERERLIEETEVVRAAEQQAREVLAEAYEPGSGDAGRGRRVRRWQARSVRERAHQDADAGATRAGQAAGDPAGDAEQIDLRDPAPEQASPQEIHVPVG